MACFSRFFALYVNQLIPVHEGKKSREVFMNSFAFSRAQQFLISGVF
jgi:hypothetical protein